MPRPNQPKPTPAGWKRLSPLTNRNRVSQKKPGSYIWPNPCDRRNLRLLLLFCLELKVDKRVRVRRRKEVDDQQHRGHREGHARAKRRAEEDQVFLGAAHAD